MKIYPSTQSAKYNINKCYNTIIFIDKLPQIHIKNIDNFDWRIWALYYCNSTYKHNDYIFKHIKDLSFTEKKRLLYISLDIDKCFTCDSENLVGIKIFVEMIYRDSDIQKMKLIYILGKLVINLDKEVFNRYNSYDGNLNLITLKILEHFPYKCIKYVFRHLLI